MWFPQARKLQQSQIRAKSEEEGVITNIKYGLLTFNAPLHDNSNIYFNSGSGFVDTVSGALLWIGLTAVFLKRKERIQQRAADILCASAFLSLWLVFSFLIYFCTQLYAIIYRTSLLFLFRYRRYCICVKWACQSLYASRERESNKAWQYCFLCLVLTIVFSNFYILGVYVQEGIRIGELNGATFRMVEQHQADRQFQFILAADAQNPYYFWGSPGDWQKWMDGDDAKGRVVVFTLEQLDLQLSTELSKRDKHLVAPFMLFMNKDMWEKI